MDPAFLKAIALGIIEGLTEYLPVSSTGHLLLAEHFLGLGFGDPVFDKTFAVLIQLGSILALALVYFQRLFRVLLDAPKSAEARNFILGILIAFLPAALLGVILHGFIKGVLFNPMIVCVTLIAGGIILLIVDRLPQQKRHQNAMTFPLPMALKIGILQCAALIPGVSRSGATIVGAMLLGADKRSAAEFSFFLAIPTMVGAFAYDLYKNFAILGAADFQLIGIGFLASFVMGLLVITGLLTYVSKHGFAVFAWWRIFLGSAGLLGFLVLG